MKKALVYLAFSILIFGLVISYDVTKCDGQVIMRHFIKSDYEPVYEADDSVQTEYVSDEIADPYIYREHPATATEDTGVEDDMTVANQDDVADKDGIVDQDDVADQNDEPVEYLSEDVQPEDLERGYEYYFRFLSDKEKQVYRSMYKAFAEVSSGNTIPTVDDESMNRVAGFIKLDHPELFYIKDMGYTHYTMGGQIQKTVIAANYTDSKTVVNMEAENMEAKAEQIIAGIPQGADDYEKVKYVYEWIVLNTDYDSKAPDNQTIKSVLLNGKSVCAGYSRTMQYLLNKMDIPTTCVEGKSLVTGENHAWNLCYVNGKYYYVDATWGDPSYKANEYGADGSHSINYDYLLVTTDEINRTHLAASDLQLPLCNSYEDNYYIRENLYLYGYDSQQLHNIFSEAYSNNKTSVSVKCANLEIYDEVRKQLIRQNGIFDYLRGDSATVSYAENEEQRTLCFWL